MNRINRIHDIAVFNLKNIICSSERRNQKTEMHRVNEIPMSVFSISSVWKIEV
ncbi:MAG TPA: hypothetical protein P5120_13180 [Spirochaetota bacterium]|nr:hypothetical protein [Spirochaetota bacterium]HPJ43582.1 hypothetical protein [Spirochaetota bacterium]HRX48466.1 hypothetical protein [Spirochaetota bacterium]